jgi:hypothetical protein
MSYLFLSTNKYDMQFRDFLEHEAEGIITAYNPWGKPSSQEDNDLANQKLAKDLANHEPAEIDGDYNGHPEKSFLIPRIALATIIDLARKYRQDAVMWNGNIVKVEDQDGSEISGSGSQSSGMDDTDHSGG